MVSNTDIDKTRKQLQDQATGQGTTMPKPEFKSVEEAVGSAAMEAAKLQTGTGDITQTVTADKFTAQAPREEQAAQVTTTSNCSYSCTNTDYCTRYNYSCWS